MAGPAGGLRRAHGACAIVRGVRNTTDFDVEYQLALINRGIYPELETVLLPASPAYQHFSSSMAREMIRYRQPLEQYLPGVHRAPGAGDDGRRRKDETHGK